METYHLPGKIIIHGTSLNVKISNKYKNRSGYPTLENYSKYKFLCYFYHNEIPVDEYHRFCLPIY